MTSSAAFVGAPLGTSSLRGRTSAPCVQRGRSEVQRARRKRVQMGLFGLGLPEIAVIAGVGLLIFGPKKVADMGKELGGMAGSVKKATSEFQEAMEESLREADEELEKRKIEKESPKKQTIDATATSVEVPDAK